jgi:hypothetical protein
MKRMHVHVSVDDLNRSIDFYSALFSAGPLVVKPDYAKWMLDDPRVNFAISTRGRQPGLDHLGIQPISGFALMSCNKRMQLSSFCSGCRFPLHPKWRRLWINSLNIPET